MRTYEPHATWFGAGRFLEGKLCTPVLLFSLLCCASCDWIVWNAQKNALCISKKAMRWCKGKAHPTNGFRTSRWWWRSSGLRCRQKLPLLVAHTEGLAVRYQHHASIEEISSLCPSSTPLRTAHCALPHFRFPLGQKKKPVSIDGAPLHRRSLRDSIRDFLPGDNLNGALTADVMSLGRPDATARGKFRCGTYWLFF